MPFLDYFSDPILQAPTVGSMLMSFSSALIGVIVFLKRRSLLGEAVSHAAYPGVVISVLFMALFFPDAHDFLALAILVGGFITSLLGIATIEHMQRRLKVKDDAALCFVLSIFFGVGILFASRIQFSHAFFYKSVQMFLYGQAATMTNVHLLLYGVLAFLVTCVLFLLYRHLQVALFDRAFASSIGIKVRLFEMLFSLFLSIAIIIGMRSVGVVLMAGMLIAPAVTARQFTHRLSSLLLLAGGVGLISGFLGNYLSVEISGLYSQGRFSLPTGPMILLVAALFAFLALLFAPSNGYLSRCVRILAFRKQCRAENVMKLLWKAERNAQGAKISFKQLAERQLYSYRQFKAALRQLRKEGWVEKGQLFALTLDGRKKAERIVRLHRLWEAYLISLGQHEEKVHRSAEEMEHIITPELEKQLYELLKK